MRTPHTRVSALVAAASAALAGALLVVVAPSASAGGPTSVLVVNYDGQRAAGALTGSPDYTALETALDALRDAGGRPHGAHVLHGHAASAHVDDPRRHAVAGRRDQHHRRRRLGRDGHGHLGQREPLRHRRRAAPRPRTPRCCSPPWRISGSSATSRPPVHLASPPARPGAPRHRAHCRRRLERRRPRRRRTCPRRSPGGPRSPRWSSRWGSVSSSAVEPDRSLPQRAEADSPDSPVSAGTAGPEPVGFSADAPRHP